MSNSPPAAPAIEGEETHSRALDAMLVAAVRFAAWGAGQGCMPHEEKSDCPEDFLLVYSEATGDKHWETMSERVSVALAQLRSDLQAAWDERDKFEADLRAAVVQVGEHARARGEAEGKMRAAEWPGIVDGWRDRAIAAESTASQLSARVRELEEAEATKDSGRDFQLMLARIIHRHSKGLDLTETIAGARGLLARKGSLSPLRSALCSSETEKQP